ncbi:hypothetical protein X777_16659, partial [Ooceraea biroi]
MDEEAPRLALSLIQSLKIYGLPLNAGFFLLSAEIYLANDKTLEALDLLKHKNIICTSRAKWHVASTVNDERIRNKIVHILLDVLCVEFTQHAFFLFQFLLKDQSSQYHPIVLQLLKILKLNLGQGIEHAKPQHIKVYLYLEVKAKNENFSHTTLRYTAEQSYNSQAITNTKTLIRNVLKKRFDPSIKLMPKFCKDRVC